MITILYYTIYLNATTITFILLHYSIYNLISRQKEMEERLIEEEVSKRVEKLVAERVAEQLESRSDEIEIEVLRRVEVAKKLLEKEMLAELQKKKENELLQQHQKEVAVIYTD